MHGYYCTSDTDLAALSINTDDHLQLRQSQTKTTFKQTSALLTRLMGQVIQTGTITTFGAALELILFLSSPTTLLYVAPSVFSRSPND